jgi:hypothetical protein
VDEKINILEELASTTADCERYSLLLGQPAEEKLEKDIKSLLSNFNPQDPGDRISRWIYIGYGLRTVKLSFWSGFPSKMDLTHLLTLASGKRMFWSSGFWILHLCRRQHIRCRTLPRNLTFPHLLLRTEKTKRSSIQARGISFSGPYRVLPFLISWNLP